MIGNERPPLMCLAITVAGIDSRSLEPTVACFAVTDRSQASWAILTHFAVVAARINARPLEPIVACYVDTMTRNNGRLLEPMVACFVVVVAENDVRLLSL